MVDPRGRGLRHHRLAMIGDAETRGFKHRNIVGAVADRQRFVPGESKTLDLRPIDDS